MRFSPDGRLLVTVGGSEQPRELESRVWDLSGPQPGRGRSLAGRWSTLDGRLVLHKESNVVQVGSKTTRSFSLRLTQRSDAKSAAPAIRLEPGLEEVLDAAISSDGSCMIAVLAADQSLRKHPLVRTWDLRADPPMSTDLKPTGAVDFVVLAPDGRRAATVAGPTRGFPSTVELWDLASNQVKPLPLDAKRLVHCVTFSPDGRRVLTIQYGQAQLWDTTTGDPVGKPLTSPGQPKRNAMLHQWMNERRQMPPLGAFTTDGRLVLVTMGDAVVHRLDAESGAALADGPIPTRDAVEVVVVSGDGRRLIARLNDETAQVFDVLTGRAVSPPLKPMEAGGPVKSAGRVLLSRPAVALSRDGRLALTTTEGAIHVWEVETGLPIGPPLPRPEGAEQVMLCDPVNVMAFTATDTVQIWDLSTDTASAGDLVRLSELLSGHRVGPDGAVVPVPTEELWRAWADLHGRRPELPDRPAESAADWHRRQAQEAESSGEPFAAVVHLDPLVAAAPGDIDLRSAGPKPRPISADGPRRPPISRR